jgi:DNA-binding NarL/FixJ family response regulator
MNISQKISTLIVDDDKEFRQSMKTLLNLYTESKIFQFQLIDEAGSLEEALYFVSKYKYTLLILDLELNQSSGINLLKYFKENNYVTKTLVLSAHQDEDWIFQTMQANARGYIFKPNVVSQLCEAITAVLNSKIYLPPEVATKFFSYFNHSYVDLDWKSQNPQMLHFTKREREVLQDLVDGLSNEEIAKHLYITVSTVKAHLTSIFAKLGVKNRSQAIVTALKFNTMSL